MGLFKSSKKSSNKAVEKLVSSPAPPETPATPEPEVVVNEAPVVEPTPTYLSPYSFVDTPLPEYTPPPIPPNGKGFVSPLASWLEEYGTGPFLSRDGGKPQYPGKKDTTDVETSSSGDTPASDKEAENVNKKSQAKHAKEKDPKDVAEPSEFTKVKRASGRNASVRGDAYDGYERVSRSSRDRDGGRSEERKFEERKFEERQSRSRPMSRTSDSSHHSDKSSEKDTIQAAEKISKVRASKAASRRKVEDKDTDLSSLDAQDRSLDDSLLIDNPASKSLEEEPEANQSTNEPAAEVLVDDAEPKELSPNDAEPADIQAKDAEEEMEHDAEQDADGKQVQDADGKQEPDADGKVVLDDDSNVMPDSDGKVVPDFDGKVVADADGKKVADADGKKLADADGKKVADADGRKVADADGRKVASADGRKVADVNGKKVADANGKKVRDADGRKVADADGKKARDADGKKVRDADGKKVPNSEGKKVPDAEGKKVRVLDTGDDTSDEANLSVDMNETPDKDSEFMLLKDKLKQLQQKLSEERSEKLELQKQLKDRDREIYSLSKQLDKLEAQAERHERLERFGGGNSASRGSLMDNDVAMSERDMRSADDLQVALRAFKEHSNAKLAETFKQNADLRHQVESYETLCRTIGEVLRDYEWLQQCRIVTGDLDYSRLRKAMMKLWHTGKTRAVLPVVAMVLAFGPDEVSRCRHVLNSAKQDSDMVDYIPEIIEHNMDETMKRDAITVYIDAHKQLTEDTEIALYLTDRFAERYKGEWHCVVGEQYALSSCYESKVIKFKSGHRSVILWSN